MKNGQSEKEIAIRRLVIFYKLCCNADKKAKILKQIQVLKGEKRCNQ